MQQGLRGIELEAALRLVHLFPRGMSVELLKQINGARAEVLETAIRKMVESLASCAHGATAQASTPKRKLLERVRTISVPAVLEFIAAEKFKVGEIVDGVKVSKSMGDDFKTRFLPKVERDVLATEICVHKLLQNSRGFGIRAEIGEEREETTLGSLWEILKLQGDAQNGALFTNGWTNIFYIRDINGNLWVVCARWVGGGWRLDARLDGHPFEWGAGSHVFSS